MRKTSPPRCIESKVLREHISDTPYPSDGYEGVFWTKHKDTSFEKTKKKTSEGARRAHPRHPRPPTLKYRLHSVISVFKKS